MRIIEIEPIVGTSFHRNLETETLSVIPEGWAIIPDNLELPTSFPQVNITLEQDGKTVATLSNPSSEDFTGHYISKNDAILPIEWGGTGTASCCKCQSGYTYETTITLSFKPEFILVMESTSQLRILFPTGNNAIAGTIKNAFGEQSYAVEIRNTLGYQNVIGSTRTYYNCNMTEKNGQYTINIGGTDGKYFIAIGEKT